MRKVFKTIGAVFGFTVLAVAAIFFAETGTLFNFSISPNALTADISSVTAPNPTPDAATDQTASINSAITPDDSGQISDTSATTTVSDGDAADAEPTQISTGSAPAETPVATQNSAPAPVLVPTTAADYPSTSTAATATITVSPTSPTPPAPPSDGAPSSSSGPTSPYDQTNFSGDANWQTTWGATSITQDGFLDIAAQSDSTGGTVYLKSSTGWENYVFSATIDWPTGQSFALLADYRDASDYVFCDYERASDGIVTEQLEDYEHGNTFVLSPLLSVPLNGEDSAIPVSISLDGLYGTCSLENQSVTSSGAGQGRTAMNSPEYGGIGFSVNDPSAGTANIIVHSVHVASQ